jgi:hypothetical protein
MYPATIYKIRLAGDQDEADLRRLAQLDSTDPLEHPILIGEIAGRPAAAIDLDSGRTVADPFQPTANLLAHLRMRAGALDAYAQRPNVADRIRAAMRRTRVVPAYHPAP